MPCRQPQDAADPKASELLGAGINIAKAAAGGFIRKEQVLNVLHGFAAKVTADMQGAVGQAPRHAQRRIGPDRVRGQVLGNVGHAVLNLASDMPGLAQVLLGLLDGVSRVLEFFSSHAGTHHHRLTWPWRSSTAGVPGRRRDGRMGLAADALSAVSSTFGTRTIGVASNLAKAAPHGPGRYHLDMGSA